MATPNDANKITQSTVFEILEIALALLFIFLIIFIANLIFSKWTRKTKEERCHELEKISHASKMKTLGEVAGNLAHEINTPLTTIHIALDGMTRAMKKDDKESVASYMHSILLAAKRMESIVNAFRRYSRVDGAKESPELIDLREVLADALEICGPDITSRGLILERSIPNQPLLTRCRPGPLAQAIINLMTNARDAALEVPKGWVKLSAIQSQGFVLIDVEDAGKGLAEGLDGRIFEPFFSTKPRGQGSGIGLGIVRDVAHAHGGEVVHLKKNGHTCFEIKIPLSAA